MQFQQLQFRVRNDFGVMGKMDALKEITQKYIKKSPLYKPKIFVGMCVHREIKVRTFRAIKSLESCLNPYFQCMVIEGDADIGRSRGRMATKFLETDFDCLLFIDDDIIFNPSDMVKIAKLSFDEDLDIVGATYVTKDENSPHFTFRGLEDKDEIVFGKNGYVKEVQWIANGCMAVKKMVFEKMVKENIVHLCHPDTHKFYPFFLQREYQLPSKKWIYLPEDYSFCQRARELGFKVWLDTTTKLDHIGQKVYNWDDMINTKKITTDDLTYKIDVQKE